MRGQGIDPKGAPRDVIGGDAVVCDNVLVILEVGHEVEPHVGEEEDVAKELKETPSAGGDDIHACAEGSAEGIVCDE